MLPCLDELRFGKAFLNYVNDPAKTDEIFRMAEIKLSNAEESSFKSPFKSMTEFALSDPEFRKLFESNYSPALGDLDKLILLPKGSLGHEFAAHMKKYDLKPDFFPSFDAKNLIRYIALRGRQVHDIWHVLTSYDTSVVGELALQAFTLAQIRSPLSATLISGGILHVLKTSPDQMISLMDDLTEAYGRGKNAKYLLGIPWEELWDRPLQELREMAGIEISR